MMSDSQPTDSIAFLFDLDGTLVDSVYQHVLAWRDALRAGGIELAVWRIHRQVGMSGGLMLHGLLREIGRVLRQEEMEHIQRTHTESYARQRESLRLLPGTRELLDELSSRRVPYAIATSGRMENAKHTLKLLDLRADVPVITRDKVRYAKPDPDLFVAAAEHLGVPMSRCVIVGDSVWDMLAARRAWALSVGAGRRVSRLSGPSRSAPPFGRGRSSSRPAELIWGTLVSHSSSPCRLVLFRERTNETVGL
jgi:HAD superfamily hydrolase (TIGR01549 family)